MHENVREKFQIIDGGKISSSRKVDVQNSKMTSPIQKVLSDINKEKAKNKFKISDLFN